MGKASGMMRVHQDYDGKLSSSLTRISWCCLIGGQYAVEMMMEASPLRDLIVVVKLSTGITNGKGKDYSSVNFGSWPK